MKAVIADPNDLFRSLLKFWLNSEHILHLAGETGDGSAVIELVSSTGADMLIMDPDLPHMPGEEMRRMRSALPEVRIIAVYESSKPYIVDHLQKAGFHGCLCKKSNTISNLRVAIESVADGNAYFCAETCRVQNATHNNAQSFARLLSIREQDILAQIGYGRNNRQIAFSLKLSPSTVQTHRRNLFRKLGLHDTPSLMRYAIEQGFCHN